MVKPIMLLEEKSMSGKMRIALIACVLSVCVSSETVAQITQSSPGYSISDYYFPDLQEPKENKRTKKDERQSNDVVEVTRPTRSRDSLWFTVSVLDKKGNPVVGITKDEVAVFIDDKEHAIDDLEPINQPSDVIFLIDVSPSFKDHFDRVKNVIEKAVSKLSKEDRVSLASFSETFKILLGPTVDRGAVTEALKKLRFHDGTSLYDAVDRTLASLDGHADRPRTVVLITDGVDTTSKVSSFERSLRNTYRSNATFWSVYLDTRKAGTPPIMSPSWQIPPGVLRGMANGQNEEEYKLGRKYLSQIVRMTGGSSFVFPRRDSELSEMATDLGNAISKRYLVKLNPDGSGPNVSMRKLRVRVARENLQVLVKSGAEF